MLSKSDIKASSESLHSHKATISNAHLQSLYQRLALVTALIPFLGTLVAVGLAWHSGISTLEVALLIGMYAVTILGIEVGFHRHFSHNAFQTSAIIRAILLVFGSMAAQGGVIYWVAHHRRHHQYTDLPGDPHSPHLHGSSKLGRLRGLWHAHVGWVLQGEISNSVVFAKNLIRDPLVTRLNQFQQVWVLSGLLIPTLIAAGVTGTWMGAFKGFLWGGLVRVYLGQQVISATNSICHAFGGQPFVTQDQSRNNFWLAIPSWGQSWHNNHHAFQNSAIAGFYWWQVDPGTWLIRVLEFVGLAWNVKAPSEEMRKAKRLTA